MDELNHGLSVPVVAGDLEGILNVLDPKRRCRRGLEQDDVELGRTGPSNVAVRELGGQPDEFCCFCRSTA
jgi:hypothetical protein